MNKGPNRFVTLKKNLGPDNIWGKSCVINLYKDLYFLWWELIAKLGGGFFLAPVWEGVWLSYRTQLGQRYTNGISRVPGVSMLFGLWHNLKLWSLMQKQFLRTWGFTWSIKIDAIYECSWTFGNCCCTAQSWCCIIQTFETLYFSSSALVVCFL